VEEGAVAETHRGDGKVITLAPLAEMVEKTTTMTTNRNRGNAEMMGSPVGDVAATAGAIEAGGMETAIRRAAIERAVDEKQRRSPFRHSRGSQISGNGKLLWSTM
jgi:hypothetical protein